MKRGGQCPITFQAGGNVGIGTTNPGYKLHVVGNSYFYGNMEITGTGTIPGGTWTGSDETFKTNIDSLRNALSVIHQLKPKSYYFDTANVYGFDFIAKKSYGFLAQDLEQILPELVKSTIKHEDVDTAGNVIHPAITYKSVNYDAFIGILTKGIQELQQKSDSLETKANNQDSINASLQNQLNQLLTTINNCCSLNETRLNPSPSYTPSQTLINETNNELNDAQTIVLEQNVPNPFAEQTAINYSLPDNTVKAQILFYNAQGKLIQSTELTQKGKGTLNVFASDLSSGIYTYTLVVDGKIIETRKMVKQ